MNIFYNEVPESLRTSNFLVVCPIYGDHEVFDYFLDSLIFNTPESIPVVFQIDPHFHFDTEYMLKKFNKFEKHKNIFVKINSSRLGFVKQCNFAFDNYLVGSILICNSDVIVGQNWIDSLYNLSFRSDVATISTLTNNGSIFSLEFNMLDNNLNNVYEYYTNKVTEIILKLKTHTRPLYPIVTTAVGHCFVVTRQALNVVGNFNEIFKLGYGEEVDFSVRAIEKGFVNLLADDTWVFHRSQTSFDVDYSSQKKINDELNNINYPWFSELNAEILHNPNSALNLSLRVAKVKINGLKIGLDCTNLNPGNTGSYEVTKNFIVNAITNRDIDQIYCVLDEQNYSEVALRTCMEFQQNFYTKTIFSNQLNYNEIDILFSPTQIFNFKTWDTLVLKSYRNIIWQLDFIFYNNLFYGLNFNHWIKLRNEMENSLNRADSVVYLSDFVSQQSLSSGIFPRSERDIVIHPGVNVESLQDQLDKNSTLEIINKIATPYIVVLGSSFYHKNRLYILSLLKDFLLKNDFTLIFIGPQPVTGSSNDEEKIFVSKANLDSKILDLGRLEDESKIKILREATLVISPSITEGFGLVPFEISQFDVPIITSLGGSYKEIAPKGALSLSLANKEDDLQKIVSLLQDDSIRAKQITEWTNLISSYSWGNTIEKFVNHFYIILSMPPAMGRDWKLRDKPDVGLVIESSKLAIILKINLRAKIKKIFILKILINQIKKILNKINFMRTSES